MKKALFVLLFITLHYECDNKLLNGSDQNLLYNAPLAVSTRDNTTCNPNATEKTKAVLRYIAALSEDPFQGALSGQSCGHTINIYKPDDMMGYTMMVENLHQQTEKWPAMIAVDYEHDEICTQEELSKANDVLIQYWNRGGLIAVGLSPQNPWLNDESDIVGNPGFWTLTRTSNLTAAQLDMIDLNDLLDPTKDVYQAWRRKLDRVADGLLELQEAGVTVLFKPLQEMNGSWFWWGILSHPGDSTPYINLYRDVYTYFTNKKGLNNIIWLYAPANSDPASLSSTGITSQMWTYPGDEYVDIISPTAYNTLLSVKGYSQLIETGKPLAMAEFGPDHMNNYGHFDNMTYVLKISRYLTGMAFWISWHDWSNGDGTNTYMSIINNKKAKLLMNDSLVLTIEDVSWNDYLTDK